MISNSSHRAMLVAVLFIVAGLSCQLQAQFGINLRYLNPSLQADGQESVLTSGFGGGLDYWFRLKKKRIEFLPEIGYESYQTDQADLKMSSFYLSIKSQFYLLNFNEDCNCPTFSKQGNTISKGFYLLLAPEVKRFSTEAETKTNSTVAGVVLGAGLDLGLADVITISPQVGYEMTTKVNDASYHALQLGLRVGLRLNEGKKKFRR